jgi:hypothetical protein
MLWFNVEYNEYIMSFIGTWLLYRVVVGNGGCWRLRRGEYECYEWELWVLSRL